MSLLRERNLFAFKSKVVTVHDVKACVGIEVKLTEILFLALDGGE
jgi:hypothetical protein